MVIDQRNAGASVTANASGIYTVDRWWAYSGVTSKFTVQQNANSVTPPAGFTNYLGCVSTSAYSVNATDTFLIRQIIEGFNVADLGWGTANAKTVTLSFQVYSSLTGTFGGSLENNAENRSYPFTYTVSSANTWTPVSITIAGDTTGTWVTNNGRGILLNFSLGTGSSLSGTAGSWAGATYYSATGATSVVGTNGATFYITGVQLEVGSSATGFEYRQFGQELALCQRYYYNLETGYAAGVGQPIGIGCGTTTSAIDVCVPFPATMRATPSIYQNTGTNYYQFYAGGNGTNFSSFKVDQVSTTCIFMQNNSAVTVVGAAAGVVYANNTNCQVGFSAEL
jgi:hypothetical protein